MAVSNRKERRPDFEHQATLQGSLTLTPTFAMMLLITTVAHFVIFDVDGTLTTSNELDTDCFVRAMSEYLGVPIVSDWSRYLNVTDSGIAGELLQQNGRDLGECSIVRSRFVRLIRDCLRANPSCCNEIAGAADFLHRLRHTPGVKIGLATGGWGESAQAKLRHVGLDLDGFAFASADDATSRTQIMLTCLEALGDAGSGDAIVYVGDGIWDVEASRVLGWPFVGIANGARADRLRTAGALVTFPNYRHPDIYSAVLGLSGGTGPRGCAP